jgi:hypothetical protein
MKNKGSDDLNMKAKTAQKSDSLDTLALGGTNSLSNPLLKRARNKDMGARLSLSLANIPGGTPLEKSYRNSYYCSSTLVQEGRKITSSYCGNRWCPVCNRIRTMKLIKGYSAPLEALNDKRFVTLTIPNVDADNLKEAIAHMNLTFRNIVDLFKKRKARGLQDWRLVGLKKLECTSNTRTNTFHPHFHLIVEGEEAANALITEWLKRYESASIKAQDSRLVTKGAEQELFKYVTKVLTKTNKGYGVNLTHQDVIFRAMKGFQVFKAINMKMEVSEEIDDVLSQDIEGIEEENAIWVYEISVRDWVNVDTGALRTGYVRSENMQSIINNFFFSELKLPKPK